MIKHFTRESNRGCSCAFRWVIYISPVGTVEKTQGACACVCMHVWNQEHTPHIHWKASIQKRKLAVVLLMLINYAALQRDNDYNQISCFKASRSAKKITPFTPPTAHAPNPSSTPWATLHFPHTQTCWGPWELPTCLCMWSYEPIPSGDTFWKTGNIHLV